MESRSLLKPWLDGTAGRVVGASGHEPQGVLQHAHLDVRPALAGAVTHFDLPVARQAGPRLHVGPDWLFLRHLAPHRLSCFGCSSCDYRQPANHDVPVATTMMTMMASPPTTMSQFCPHHAPHEGAGFFLGLGNGTSSSSQSGIVSPVFSSGG